MMSCEDPIDRLDAGPRVGAACARAGAAFARDGAALARDGAAFARDGAALARDGVAFARADAAVARAGAAFARDPVAFARDGAAAFAREGAAFARDGVAFARAGAALRVPVALALAPVARAAGADLAGVAARREAMVLFLAAVVFFAAPALRVPEGRPAGPVLRRAAPPRPSARMVRASVFTSSGLRSVEVPETPRRRSWPRMSSTFIREISDSDTIGVFGVRLPVCRLVRVAVAPRPELLR
ncbi:hypothetical protein O7619_00725 [Micromonospora sp. WMMD998]|nr:hypothetical protein [Micromonospora sp. WMMD998]WFE37031.1 hypothetical protein O7619_00725 [Micromonospora sp. WMMD998]